MAEQDPQNADGDFRYRDLATGEVMVFQWQVLVMDWVHMGTIERHNVEAFRAFKEVSSRVHKLRRPDLCMRLTCVQGCLHDSTYRLPNNQFDKGKFREHMNLAISQMRGGSSPNKQGGTPVPPAAPPSTPASGPAHDDFVHPQRKKLFQPPPVFKPQRRPPGESPTAQLRHQLQQQHTSQGIPTGPRSGSAGYRPPQSASISQADPFVSNDPVHSASQNPSASWLREQHHWQEQENRRIALINAHQQRYEVQRQEAQRDFDIQRLNQAAVAANNQAPSPVPPNYPNNLQQQSTTTPTRPIPHREELRRTVLHDPYRNSNTPHPASSSNTTTPIGKPSTTPYNAQRTMGDAQSQQGHHYWNSQRTAGTTHTARDPWSPSASSFPGNRNPLPPSLHPNITSDFDDLGSPHLPDDDLRDFYKPVDFNARPLTAPDAMRPNTAAPVVIKPIATPQSVASESRSRPDTAPGTNPKAESGNGNGSLNINDTIQTVEKAVAEAAEQEAHLLQIAVDERSYNEKLDAWWTSGLSHLPGLHMGVAGRVLHAKQAGRKDVESAAFLMGLLHFRFQEYEDDQTFRAGYQHNFGDVSANNRWLDSHARFARRFPSRFVAPEPGTCVDGGESGYVDSLFLAQGPTLPRSEPQQATSERPMRHEQVQGYEHSNKVDGGMRAVEEFPVLKAAMDARLMQDAQALGGLERESEADGQRARVVLPGARVPRCARGLGGRVGEVGGSGAVKDSRWNPRPEGW